MRSALASILIVLQYAAQLQCRSVTRNAHPSPRAAVSSREDLGSLIARNREITDLLIPLLEANLETKRKESKRSDLLKVFRDPKARKDPVVELLPLTKRQTRDRKPVALILASELRSQKSKKGRNKVHAQKAFIIQNEEKVSSSEEDYDFYKNEDDGDNNTVEESDEDIKNTHKRLTVKHEYWSTEESSGDDSYDEDDVESEDAYHQNVVKETSEDDVTEEAEKKKKHKEIKQSFNSQFIESYSEEYDETKSSGSSSEEEKLSEANVDTSENSERETPEHVNIEEVLTQSVGNSAESTRDHNSLELENPENDQSSSYEETEEIGDDIARRYRKRKKPKKKGRYIGKYDSRSSSEERIRLTSYEENKYYNVNPVVQNSPPYRPPKTWPSDSRSVSGEFLYDDDDQSYDSVIYASSEENQLYEDQNTYEVESQYDDYVTNENDDSVDVSNYYENDGDGSYEDVEYEDDDANYNSESNQYTDEGNYGGFDVELDNQGYDDYEDTDTGYYDTADNYSGGTSVETSYDDFPSDNDDTYSDDYADDNNYDSYEYRQAFNNDENKTLTFSEEIAKKYAADSKYSVENDKSLTEPSGELGKFDVESVEGLIEVLKLDDDDDKSKCEDDDESKEDTVEKLSDHSHEIHKSYKLSFKFNK